MKIKELMTQHVISVNPKLPIPEAQKRMKDGGFRRLPVLENGELGSGLIQDVSSDLQVVPMNEQPQPSHMQLPRLRKRQGLPHKLTQPLPERVVPTLHMIRLPAFLANSFMLIAWHHARVRLSWPYTST